MEKSQNIDDVGLLCSEVIADLTSMALSNFITFPFPVKTAKCHWVYEIGRDGNSFLELYAKPPANLIMDR